MKAASIRPRKIAHVPATVHLEPAVATRRDEFIAAARRSRRSHQPWVHAPDTPVKYERLLERAADSRHQTFFICRSDGGELVGVANLNEIVRGALQSAYLGYYAFEPWAGQGLMRAGLALVLHEAFVTFRLHRVEANIQPGNLRSIALVRRLGFRREGFSPRYLKIGGRWCDHERWAILVEDWRTARRAKSAR